MTEEQKEDEEILEVAIKLPKILNEPIELDDGSKLDLGDKVAHQTFGIGTVVRLSFSERLGNLVYVDFQSGKDEIVGASYLRKLDN